MPGAAGGSRRCPRAERRRGEKAAACRGQRGSGRGEPGRLSAVRAAAGRGASRGARRGAGRAAGDEAPSPPALSLPLGRRLTLRSLSPPQDRPGGDRRTVGAPRNAAPCEREPRPGRKEPRRRFGGVQRCSGQHDRGEEQGDPSAFVRPRRGGPAAGSPQPRGSGGHRRRPGRAALPQKQRRGGGGGGEEDRDCPSYRPGGGSLSKDCLDSVLDTFLAPAAHAAPWSLFGPEVPEVPVALPSPHWPVSWAGAPIGRAPGPRPPALPAGEGRARWRRRL